MTPSEPNTDWRRRLAAPSTSLVAILMLSAGLMAIPDGWTERLRDPWETVLAPAQQTARDSWEFARANFARVQTGLVNADDVAAARRQAADLAAQNRQLVAQVQALRLHGGEAANDHALRTAAANTSESAAPLLNVETISARVLGESAQNFLRAPRLWTWAPGTV